MEKTHNIHDKFVKHTLGNPVGAKAFIQHHLLKDIVAKIDLDSLRISNIHKQIQSEDFYFSKGRLFLYFLLQILFSCGELYFFFLIKKVNKKNQAL